MRITKLTQQYVPLVNNFECGNDVIDNFLKKSDALDENQGITYILLDDDECFIVGYYNIEVGRVDRIEEIGDYVNYIPMGGSVNINYLAIHNKFKGYKIGEIEGKNVYLGDFLLRDCEKRILELRDQVGISFVTLYSTEQGFHLYHDRNSYELFEEDMNTFVQESDIKCIKLYKYVDDIVKY